MSDYNIFSGQVIQFFETMQVRHGVMLVGPTGGGKTVCYEVLADTLTSLHKGGLSNWDFFLTETLIFQVSNSILRMLKINTSD